MRPFHSKRGDEWAKKREEEFLAAHDEYADAIFRHCLVRVRERELAKDIAQETFSRTWVYISTGKNVGHIRAFLYRVANNLIVDHSRKKKSSSLDKLMEEDNFEPKDESIAEPKDKPALRQAMNLLNQLDEMYRVAVTMRFIDEMTPKEIAKALEVSENVVSVRIHRGLERLRSLLHDVPPPDAMRP